MPENKNCKPFQSPGISDHRRKKKKRKKISPAPEKKEKPLDVSLPPETLPVSLMPPQDKGQTQGQLPKPGAASKKKREQHKGRSQKSQKQCKDLQTPLTATHKSIDIGALADLAELSIQTRKSLRWEGVLQDPQEEAKRLEQYRTNRRQRYITRRERLLKETQHTLKQTVLKESRL
ncbi:protein LIAT1 [Melanotaenia boesemani]|uniref:protein LIAT1 n=1 Tax=Melanotaenia boesemani TaxID=1250792 RepID=UPI001C03FB7C|nr:protein LIAT1 [Melanotaenia boesemani]